MILRVHSEASYLSVTKARSREGGYHYLSNNSEDPPNWTHSQRIQNHDKYHGVGSRGRNWGIIVNTQDSVPERSTLIEMGHPKTPKIIQVENTTANKSS